MAEAPPPSPENGTPQPLLAGLDARRLVAGMLEDTGPWPLDSHWEPPIPEVLQSQLAGFEVRRMLGRGGMGAVYLAMETRLGREVAIKLLPPELGRRRDFRQRFEREARILAQLDHPRIVRLHGMGESEDGHLFLVMEYVKGTSLAELLHGARASQKPGTPAVPWPRVVRILTELCEALAHAHAQGLVHRDLKPANVLLTPEGSVKLADFGLARPLDPSADGLESRVLATQTGQVMGTYDYMAPEQRDGKAGDHRVDLYGLGILTYQLLAGVLPRGAFVPPSALVGTGPSVDRLVQRALAADPAKRTPSADAFRAELLACPSDGRRSWKDRNYGRAAAVLLGVGLAVVALRPGVGPVRRSAPPEVGAAGVASSSAESRESFLGHRLRPLTGFPGVWVAEAETTVAQYRRFAEATGRQAAPAQWAHRVGDPLSEILNWQAPGRSVTESEPVVAVSAPDARDFCHWMTRTARAAGDLAPGQEYRLPTDAEWLQAHVQADPEAPGRPGARLEEWLIDPFDFQRPWPAVRRPLANRILGSRARALHHGGHTGRGFRVVLDLKTPELQAVSARVRAAVDVWGGGTDGRPPVDVLVTGAVVRVDLTRRPDIDSLEPLRGLGLTEFRAAPSAPLDLAPLAGQPLTSVTLHGPVVSLGPLARCPLTRLSLGTGDPLVPSTRRPSPPSLVPLLLQPRLTHLAWRGFDGGPDVRLGKFPALAKVTLSDCAVPSLDFLSAASGPLALMELVLEDMEVDLLGNREHLQQVARLPLAEPLLAEADRRALRGDLTGALGAVEKLQAGLSAMPWWDDTWRDALERRRRCWTDWQSLGLGPWLEQGAQGPPPGSVPWRGRWFYFLRTSHTRAEAEWLAASWGAQLATLADPEEEAFVRASVLPAPAVSAADGTPDPVYAHLGAWRPDAAGAMRWVSGEPWTAGPPREHRTREPGRFLVLKSGDERWFAESRQQRLLPVLLEWGTATETGARVALENRLTGSWTLDDQTLLELKPRGRVGPDDAPGDSWFVVDAAAGQVLVCRFHGRQAVRLTTTDDPDRLALTRPDGTTAVLVRGR